MRATVLFLASFSAVQAQSPNQGPFPSPSASDHSLLRQPSEVQNGNQTGGETAGLLQHPSQPVSPTWIASPSERPYSQLAGYLNCNDWSPNTWNNYAAERAAIASQISQHVDLRCSCFDCKQGLHSSACAAGCGECSTGCRQKPINRYRAPVSTLFDQPSDAFGSTSAGTYTAKCVTPATLGFRSNQSAPGQLVQPGIHPASAMFPMALPPRDRVASPAINNPRPAIQLQDSQSNFQATR